MKKIKLTQGKFALVDNEDFEYLSQWIWVVHKGWDTYYARAFDYRGSKKPVRIYMHRIIYKAKKGDIVDHINRNGLDNRKENLHIVSPSVNNLNQKKRIDNTSGYKGIWWNDRRKKWIVEMWKNKKKYYFGGYIDFDEAIRIHEIKYKMLWDHDTQFEFMSDAYKKGLFKPCQS